MNIVSVEVHKKDPHANVFRFVFKPHFFLSLWFSLMFFHLFQNPELQPRPQPRQTLDPTLHRSHEARPHAVHQHAAAPQDADPALCGRQCGEGRRTSRQMEMCSNTDTHAYAHTPSWQSQVLWDRRLYNVFTDTFLETGTGDLSDHTWGVTFFNTVWGVKLMIPSSAAVQHVGGDGGARQHLPDLHLRPRLPHRAVWFG